MGGAGVLRFRPQAGDDIQRIQLKYGVGFRTFVLDAFEAEVMVERSRYYLDPLDLAAPASVADPVLPEDPGAGTLRRNLALRAGLGLQLGGRLTAAARDHIMSGPELDGAAVDFEDVKDPRDLVHNWQMSAGLKILVGGDRRSRRDRSRERRAGAAAVPAQPNAADAPEPEPSDAPELEPEPSDAPEPEPIIDELRPGQNRLDPSLEFPTRELRPYTGVQLGANAQWVYGVATDWGPSGRFPSFNVVPEASLGLGQGKPTWMVAVNLQYRLRGKVFERDTYWISPVASFGPGLLDQDGTELVLNASYGVNVQLQRIRSGGGDPLNLYVAHQGLDLFESNRLILGLSLER